MNKNTSFTFSVLVATSFVFSCSKSQRASPADEFTVGPTGYYAVETQKDKTLLQDPLRKQIGSFFLVEQFNAKIFASMEDAIRDHAPGGIVFWNPDKVGAKEVYDLDFDYSKTADEARQLAPLFSADYEGGGMSRTPEGKNIPGIQRFTEGFTSLAHPAWLGVSMEKFGTKLCRLHGQIMAQELKAVGINYPLATVSDLAMNMFRNRGISTDPKKITACLEEIVNAFAETSGEVFVTKHFPGLGETRGDTHEETVVSKAKTMDELKNSLFPFAETINYVNQNQFSESYSILASHAKYDVLDKDNITTVSKPILTDFLRGQLHFNGVVVSDAMWMGEYGHMQTAQLLVVYLKSVLAGMDMLMIPGKTFAPAVSFFRAVYDNTLKADEKALIAQSFGMSWDDIHTKFMARLQESSARVAKLKQASGYFYKTQTQFVEPKTITASLTSEYKRILAELGLH